VSTVPSRTSITALQDLHDGLEGCIGCGCLSLRTCGLSNAQDVAGASGPGARHLARRLRRPVP
jgi:MerR family redox-sensitive transcriptional activator SoxR